MDDGTNVINHNLKSCHVESTNVEALKKKRMFSQKLEASLHMSIIYSTRTNVGRQSTLSEAT